MATSTLRTTLGKLLSTTGHWVVMAYVLVFSVGFAYSVTCFPFQAMAHNWYADHLTFGSQHVLFWMLLVYLTVGAALMIALAHRHAPRPDSVALLVRSFLLPQVIPIALLFPAGRRAVSRALQPWRRRGATTGVREPSSRHS